jgi:hypothetical protein
MSTLAFFPWLHLTSGFTVGEFELIPFVRGSFAGTDAAAVHSILSPYEEVAGLSVRDATLLRIHPSGLTDDLTEIQVSAAFTFAQMLSFAGLAVRQFFHHSGYSNHDHFQLVVQRYDDPIRGVGVVTRRRDGSTQNLVTASVHRVPRPDHVHRSRVPIDVPLLAALNACTSHASADELVDAMLTYNMANTDSSAVSPHVELVLSVGAFERVLGCRNGNHNDLANAFIPALAPRVDIARADCPRLQAHPKKFPKAATVREAWIRDLFNLRGDLAHGKVGPEYPSMWSLQEHLLLAAFAFPFVMKVQLQRAGLYTLTDRDRDGIEAFEYLACAENLFAPVGDPDKNWFQWNEVFANVPSDPARMAEVGRILETLIDSGDSST